MFVNLIDKNQYQDNDKQSTIFSFPRQFKYQVKVLVILEQATYAQRWNKNRINEDLRAEL